jgi:hypothetical protein
MDCIVEGKTVQQIFSLEEIEEVYIEFSIASKINRKNAITTRAIVPKSQIFEREENRTMAASPSPTRASLERNMRAAIAHASSLTVSVPSESPMSARSLDMSPKSPPLSPTSRALRAKVNKPLIAPTEGREYVSNAREELAHGLNWLFKSNKFLDTTIIVG